MEGEKGVTSVWLLILCNLFALLSITAGSYQVLSWRGSVPIREYTSFVDATFFVASVPPLTWQATWRFNAYKSDDVCEDRTIYIVARYGSFPLLRPNDESFPKDFNLHQTHTWASTFSTQNFTYVRRETQPLPGDWYVAYFINDYVDDKITQKGLGGLVCQYFVESEIHMNWLEHVEVIDPGGDKAVSMDNMLDKLFRVLLSELTWQVEISVHSCNLSTADGSSSIDDQGCPLMISLRGEGLPELEDPVTDSQVKNCSGQDPCTFVVNSVSTNEWNYIRFKSLHNETITFTMRLSTRDCDRHEYYTKIETVPVLPRKNMTTNSSLLSNETVVVTTDIDDGRIVTTAVPVSSYFANTTNDTVSLLTSSNSTTSASNRNICVWLPEMARVARSSQSFKSAFQLFFDVFPLPNKLVLPENKDVILKFTLKPGIDTGGTLRFAMEFTNPDEALVLTGSVGVFEACIQRRRIPTSESKCDPGHKLILSSTGTKSPVVYFPYPEPGAWYVSLRSKCYSNGTEQAGRELRNCSRDLAVAFSISIDRCVDDQCGNYGKCLTYYAGDLHYATCRCYAKWRGYGCTDGTVGETDGEQLTAVLLLTLSNFAFVPCIVVSLYRRFFLEALVYFFTMFFSTFYHACDGDRAYFYCMIPYNTLAVCDFFGAIMSFWVTMIAMSRLTEPVRSFLYMLAGLGLSLGVTWDRHSLWTFLVPVLVAFIIMAITWGLQMKQKRSCYPTKKRWLFRLLPGILIALLGLFIYAFLETQSNYQYTHSSWHACMAFAVVFLLPPKRLNRVRKHRDGHPEYHLDSSFDVSSNVYQLDNPGFVHENEIIHQKF